MHYIHISRQDPECAGRRAGSWTSSGPPSAECLAREAELSLPLSPSLSLSLYLYIICLYFGIVY